jgi:hypothetical protein
MGRGSKSTEVKVPEWLEDAAKAGLARADAVSRIPYAPYYGPDVAAMTPAQIASMQGTNSAASAFGLQTVDPMAGMPEATNYNGIMAYSSGSGYDAALAELERRQPGTYKAIMRQFIDPVTGKRYSGASGRSGASAPASANVPMSQQSGGDFGGGDRMPAQGGLGGTTSMSTLGSYMPGGINTSNPDSFGNRMAAAVSPSQGAPTQANRPVSRPADGGSAGMGGRK